MRLGIISDAHHYYDESGMLSSLTPVVRQFEQWAKIFDSVTICAPLLSGSPPVTYQTFYMAANIQLLPITNAGGNTLLDKLFLVQQTMSWWRTLKKLIKEVDAIHIRCPNNISILGLLAIQNAHILRQAVYTGTWQGYAGEPITYAWQRLFLRRFFEGPVAVYGDWPNQPHHIVPSFSPSYSQTVWESEKHHVSNRIRCLSDRIVLPEPVRLLTVGSLNHNKNQRLVIRVAQILRQAGIQIKLDLLGDGDQFLMLEQLVKDLKLGGVIKLHGQVSQDVAREFYRQADFVVQASYAEGFGKVPIEAFFHGAIPILSDVGMSIQIVGGNQRGRVFPTDDANSAVQEIMALIRHPDEMIRLIRNGRVYAKTQTLEAWQEHIHDMLRDHWKADFKNKTKEKENATQ